MRSFTPSRKVHLWFASLREARPHLQRVFPILNGEEQARADRFRVESAGNRFVTGRAMSRLLLGALTDQAPEEIEFSIGEHGKPRLEPEGPEFNLAHSGDTIVMATATDPIGVDVEEFRTFPNADRLAIRICTVDELEFLNSLPDKEREIALLRLWTCKEAVLKGLASGISGGLRSVQISLSPTAPPFLISTDSAKNPWTLLNVPLPVDAVCTVAVRGGPFDFKVHPFAWAEKISALRS